MRIFTLRFDRLRVKTGKRTRRGHVEDFWQRRNVYLYNLNVEGVRLDTTTKRSEGSCGYVAYDGNVREHDDEEQSQLVISRSYFG